MPNMNRLRAIKALLIATLTRWIDANLQSALEAGADYPLILAGGKNMGLQTRPILALSGRQFDRRRRRWKAQRERRDAGEFVCLDSKTDGCKVRPLRGQHGRDQRSVEFKQTKKHEDKTDCILRTDGGHESPRRRNVKVFGSG